VLLDGWLAANSDRDPSAGRFVLLGGGPLVPQVRVPGIIELLASPAGALMVRMPDTPQRLRSILRQSRHGPSLDAGRIPELFIDWRVALGRDTHSMRNEREMVRAIVRGRNWRPGLTFDDAELAAIERPAMCVYGTADQVGTADTWKHVTGLMPRGKLVVLNGLGHQPWLDDPSKVAAEVGGFLADG
jgi:pimeloyl-ACP methyl ester carboxylesterase